jgi:hypothetical protein
MIEASAIENFVNLIPEIDADLMTPVSAFTFSEPDGPGLAPEPKRIDEMTLTDYRRGIARVMARPVF